MTAATAPVQITTPGVYALDFETYLSDPVPGGSLSTSGAKTLLNETPATFAYEREHGRPDKLIFDVGHAAHTAALGDGMQVRVIPDDILSSNGSTNTKAAKEFIAAARADGAAPIKPDVAAQVEGMATALREHPVAGKLLNLERGQVEQSGFWIDTEFDVWRRCRFDYMGNADGRFVIVDYKSADNLADRVLGNAIGRYGYDQQDAWYCDGAKALDLDDDPRFLLIFQAKTPPYLVRVIELPARWVEIGRDKNRRALDIYAQCRAANDWPGYPLDIEVLDPPAWVEYEQEDMVVTG